MTNKAKTYLRNIQEARYREEADWHRDRLQAGHDLSCNDLGSLCRAAEDRRYSLRNNEETLKLKQILFFRTKAEMDAYHDMSRKPEDWTEAEIEQQRSRFCSVWQVIEEANWSMNTRLGRKPTPTPNSTQKVHAPKRGCASYPMCLI